MIPLASRLPNRLRLAFSCLFRGFSAQFS